MARARFALALEVLAALAPLRNDSERGLAGGALAQQLHVDHLQIEPALAALTALRWVGGDAQSATSYLEGASRGYVLLADPQTTALAPLLEVLLLRQRVPQRRMGERSGWAQHTVAPVLPTHRAAGAAVNVNGAEEGAAI